MKFITYKEKRNSDNRLIRRYKVYNFLLFKIKKKVLPVFGENNKIIVGGRELTENEKAVLDTFGKIIIDGNNNIIELPDMEDLKCDIRIAGDSNSIKLQDMNDLVCDDIRKMKGVDCNIRIVGNNNSVKLSDMRYFKCDIRKIKDFIYDEVHKMKDFVCDIRIVGNSNLIELSYKDKLICNIVVAGNSNKFYIGKFNLKKATIRNSLYIDARGNYNNREVTIEDSKTFIDGYLSVRENNRKIYIGKDCMFSWGICIWTTDVHPVYDLETNKRINEEQDIIIGDHVWVGKDVHISKGSVIPSGCVVGAKSFVNKAFTKENCILAGIPAKVVKENIRWEP